MHNLIYLIGRLVYKPTIEDKEGKKKSIVTLAVQRPFKNEEETYETDFISCVLWDGLASNTAKYCDKGDLVGLKGRVQMIDEKLIVVAEKVSFLATKKGDEEDGE